MFLDVEYINRVSSQLEGFRWTNRQNTKALFRCPYCGDSHTNERKTRGSIYFENTKQKYLFNCFNCGKATEFKWFLKDNFPNLYQEYKVEGIRGIRQTEAPLVMIRSQPKTLVVKPSPINWCKLSELPLDHVAVHYCLNTRKLPQSVLTDLYYTLDLNALVNSLDPTGDYSKTPNWQCVVFPLRRVDGSIFGLQARTIDRKGFLTFKFDDTMDKVYGLHKLKQNLPKFVFEAIIDSMFIPNSLAVVGGSVTQNLLKYADTKNTYIALDNEPRHKDVKRRMAVAIELGYKVCFWQYDSSLKDVNDMVKAGITSREIVKHIVDNSCSGLAAKVKLSSWSKV